MLLTNLVPFVAMQSIKYNIDSTHGLAHSMNTLFYVDKIFKEEVKINPTVAPYENIIYTSAVLHDMCDGKYMDKEQGIQDIRDMMKDKLTDSDVDSVINIISTMSYSYIQKHGFPDWGDLQPAYHMVREADLLTSYDVDRSILYHLNKNSECECFASPHSLKPHTPDLRCAFANANELFAFRVLTLRSRNYFTTKVGKKESEILERQAMDKLMFWKQMLAKR